MLIYFVLNSAIAFVALTLIRFGHGSPRSNYYLSTFALATWLIPYHWIAQWAAHQTIVNPLILRQVQQQVGTLLPTTNMISVTSAEAPTTVLVVLLTLGGGYFILTLLQNVRATRSILDAPCFHHDFKLSEHYKTPIYRSTHVSTGLLLGLRKPKIVIAADLQDPQQIDIVVAHERTHQRRHDNLRLLFLSYMACLFWWNPWVRWLVQRNRFLIEALCDAQTGDHLGRVFYLEQLASLLLTRQQRTRHPIANAALSKKRNNIERLQLLKEPNRMTLPKMLMYSFVFCVSLSAVTWTSFASALTPMVESTKADSKGALIEFDIEITEYDDTAGTSVSRSELSVWVDFNKRARVQIGENYRFDFTISDRDDSAAVDMEIVDLRGAEPQVIASPSMRIAYGKSGLIEIANDTQTSPEFSVRLQLERATQPRS
ncbi:hypothetical protein IDAT_10550 [Pseudidiomarina atlantica]|uniref:Peptidase M56 domain-containing protein n=1 Tax=Pseudidiomarina atlantica TaxID=1517416 RepID=A0A094J612_9GAMM|nr:M56 family metallopeptidase [Pseudidiomarina atlantica]KFZ28026.1 hypothetical protein IDAT_10550 [Pseudidiomarina atlantica]